MSRARLVRSLLVVAAALAAAAAGAAASEPAAAAAGAAGGREFAFPRLNRTYHDLVGELQPIRHGPFTVRLSSPRQTIVLRSHRLELRPAAGGVHAGTLELEVMGKGWLVGDVDAAGLATRLQDELQVPPQTLRLDGRVRLERAPDGYRVTPLELPARVEVVIRSGLVADLIGWCDRLAAVPFADFDCVGLERSLERVAVPLPPAGESYLLPDAELRDEDRLALDRYLETR